MADNTIDTLMLEVESNAEKSADGLDRLAASLAKIGKLVSGAVTPLSSFASSIKEATTAINSLGSTREISSLLSQLTQLSRIRLDNLENKKIRIDFELNGVESGQLKYAIQKAIDGVKVDTSAISKKLAQSFNLSKEATAKLQSQMQTIANSMATSFDGKNFHMSDTLDSTLEEIAQNIRENGSVIRSSLTDSLDFAMNEYKEFYDYFSTHKIYISDYLKADIGKTEFAEIIQQNLSYITRNAAKGIELNSVWEELSSKFPTLIPPGITNAADQVVHVLEEIRNARDQIKPIAIDDLVSSEQTAAMDGVWQSILDSTRNLSTVLSQRIKDATEYAQDKINLDVKVNEEKIIQDIRNAINRAASAQYDPVKVKLSVDSKNIQNSVSQELKGIDPGNLPQISDGMEKIANAMIMMNGVKFKDTGLSSIIKSLENLSSVDTTKFNADGIAGLAGAIGTLGYINFKGTGLNSVIKSLRELSSVDMSNFNTGSFSEIVQSISSLGQIPDISSGINKLVASLAKLASSGQSITTVAQQLPILGNALRDVVSRLASAEDVSAAVNVFVQSLARLAGAGAKTAETAAGLETLGQATLDFFRTMQGAPQISENTLRMTEALSRLAASGAGVGQATNAASNAFNSFGNSSIRVTNLVVKAFSALGNTIKRTINIVVKAFNTLGKAFLVPAKLVKTTVETIISSIGKISSAAKTMETMTGKAFGGMLSTTKNVASGILSSAKSIVSSFTLVGTSGKVFSRLSSQLRSILRIALPFTTIWGAINLTKQSVELSSSLTEIQNVVRTTFGDMTQEVNEFAKSAVKDLGMSELTFKQVASRYQAMGTAMGISSGQVQKATQFLQEHSEMYGKTADSMGDMSIELTRLAADMASFYDVDAEEVADKLSAIFTGQARPLRSFGIDLTEATLAEWALKNGIDANIDSMSQAQKTLLRYQYVLAQTGAAQGDFQKTILTWANQSRILKESFKQVGSIIGEVIINAIKPFVIALNSALGSVISFTRTVADALGKIFGWTIEIDTGGVTNDMEDASDSMEDFADDEDDAADSAKKLKKQLSVLPFDELNQLAKDLDEVGKSKSGKDDDLDDILTTDGLSASLVKGEGLFDKYKSDINDLYELGEYIGIVLTKTLKKINWDKIYSAASEFGRGLAAFLNGLISPELFSEVGDTIAGALNTIMHGLDTFGETFNWENFGKSLSDGVKGFLTTYDWDLRVETFNTFANGILDAIIAALDNVTDAEWQRIPQKIADMVRAVDATGIGWKLGKIANSLANAFYQLVSNKVTWASLGKKIGDGINSFLKGMNAINPKTKMSGWETLGEDISNSISGITISITKALGTVHWEDVGQAIADFIGGINFGEIGWNLGKLGNALANALYGVVSKKDIWSNLGNNIASGLNNFFSSMNNVNKKGFTGWQTLGKGITDTFSGIASSITTALEGVKWEEVGQAIADFIGSISFGEISWNLGGLANSLVNAFYALVSNESIWSNLGDNIASGINTFLLGMGKVNKKGFTGWEVLGQSITKSITGIASSITTALQGVHWEDVGQAIADFISGINFEEIGWSLGELVNSLVGALKGLVSKKESWVSLGSGMANGINNFFSTINWESVGLTLDGLFAGIVEFISNLAETGDWEEIGRNIGTALSGVDWGTHLYEAAKAIATILGDLLKGFGSTTAGKWIIGIGAAFTAAKLAVKIGTFVNGVATLLGGGVNVLILRRAMKGLIGSAAATASTTAAGETLASGMAGSVSGGLLAKAATLGTGISLALGVAVAQVKVNEITGGPGTFFQALSELVGGLIEKLSESPLVKEGMEKFANFTEEFVKGLRSNIENAFKLLGIETAFDKNQETTPEIEVEFSADAEEFKTGVKGAKDYLDETLPNETSVKINAKDNTSKPVSTAKTNIESLPNETSVELNAKDNTLKPTTTAKANIKTLPNETLVNLNAKDNTLKPTTNARNNITSVPDKKTVNLNAKDNTLKPTTTAKTNIESLPNETSVELNAKDNASQVFKDADTNIDTSTANIKKNITTRTKSAYTLSTANFDNIAQKATNAFGTVESEANKKWGSSKDSVTGALSTIDEETKNKMNSVMTIIQQKWSSVLINTNQIWEKASSKVGTETGNMKTHVDTAIGNILKAFTDKKSDFENTGSSLVKNVLYGMTSISSYDISWQLSGLISNIQSAFNFNDNMYANGRNAIVSFINGLKSMQIPLPHLKFTTSTKQENGSVITSTSSSIDWYAMGGLFNSPSVIGVGEAGAEAVLPLTNKKVINSISGALLSGMQDLPISRYRLASMEDMTVKHDIPKMSQSQMPRMHDTQIDSTELMDAITGAVVTAMMNNQQNPINVTCYAELKTENDEVLARAVTRGQKSLDYRYNPTPKFGY